MITLVIGKERIVYSDLRHAFHFVKVCLFFTDVYLETALEVIR